MTDRLKGVWVAFEHDIREDDAEALTSAIKQLRGVLAVEPQVVDVGDWVAEERVRADYRTKLMDILWPKKKPA